MLAEGQNGAAEAVLLEAPHNILFAQNKSK